MKMIILQHNEVEGPGLIQDWAEDNQYDVLLLRPDRGALLDRIRADQFDLLVIMGGGNSATDSDPWLQSERDLIHRAHEANKPIFGVCLGAQQIALAFGGRISNIPVTEIGWFPVQADQQSPLALPETLTVLHWHGQQFTLPPDAKRLFTNSMTLNQGFMLGNNIIGLQFHFEMKAENLGPLIDFDHDYLAATNAPNAVQQTPEQIAAVDIDAQNKTVLYQLLDSITK
ncbi:type 1 glutamine amidotransferase [Nicoliella spurrieriana]|uniref:Type 1 glutamine amidotransferase n=1 Tax=Nicoliella spurrieriana TaxID=2925830 RepID=A0A976RT58_9LACO|nr:type 1 glutamine amidotransferase [Nicoliella spurrieriana]UQS87156.1 type 1 glutamine amidotransferase [Nicoliella spurrieriana]